MQIHDPGSDETEGVLPLAGIPPAADVPGPLRLPHRVEPSPHAPDEGILDQSRFLDFDMRVEKLAERFDQLEFLIVEQFEPGMTGAGGSAAGNLRDRLDRIEAALDRLTRQTDANEDGTSRDPKVPGAVADRLEARIVEALSANGARRADLADAIVSRMDVLEHAVSELGDQANRRLDSVLDAIERATTRPPPSPDLTIQHRSFAAFATALQVSLRQFESSTETMMSGLEGVKRHLEALEAKVSERTSSVGSQHETGPLPLAGLETSLGDLSDRLGALARVFAARSPGSGGAVIAAMSARLDKLDAMLSAAVEGAAQGNRELLEETLRDLRMAVAEIAAENRRLRVA